MTDNPMQYQSDAIPADRVMTTGPVKPILTSANIGPTQRYLLPALRVDDPRIGVVIVALATEELAVIRDWCDLMVNSTGDQRRQWVAQLDQGGAAQ